MPLLAERYQETARRLALLVSVLLTPTFWTVVTCAAREVIIIGGWRAGKSTVIAFVLFLDIWMKLSEGRTRLLYWIVGPDYSQTDEEFRYVYEWASLLGIVRKVSIPQEGPRALELEGNVYIETKSAQYHERLGSVAPDGIIVCEAGQVSEDTRTMLLGRTMEKSAWIRYAGTLEDDEGHQQWAWYQENANDWSENPTPGHAAFSLPSWSNDFIFASCEKAITSDPSLVRFCPDADHGTGHGGFLHPEIQLRKEIFDPHTFDRRIAAIATGVQFQVYTQLEETSDEPFPLLEDIPPDVRWIDAAGGVDYGTVHPSALTAIKVAFDPRDDGFAFKAPRGIAWAVESWLTDIDPGDHYRLGAAKRQLEKRWGIGRSRWGVDPNERFMARVYQGEAVSGSRGAREARMGLVIARLNLAKAKFWKHGTGIATFKQGILTDGLYWEARRIHRRKTKAGMLELVRDNDDRTASWEDGIEKLDGKLIWDPSAKPQEAQRKYSKKRSREYVGV